MDVTSYETMGIDVHGHGVPAALVSEARHHGDRYGGISVTGVEDDKSIFTFPGQKPLRPIPHGMMDLDKRIAWLEQQHLAAQLVAPWLDVAGHQLGVEGGCRWAAFVNECLADQAKQSKGRLFGLATLHLGNPDRAAKELERSVRELGLVGAMIPTHYGEGQASDGEMDVLWETAAALSVPIVIHPPIEGPASAIPNSTEFRSLYGRPLETTFVAATLLVRGVFERYKGLKLVLVHGGGFLPFQGARLDNYFQSGTLKGSLPEDRKPSDYLNQFYYDTVLMSDKAVDFLVRLAGPDRVVLGSDYPFFMDGAPILEAPLKARFDKSVMDMIARGNAALLFGV